MGKAGKANQQRDKQGRFTSKGQSFAARGLEALKAVRESKYAKPAAKVALAVGASMLHRRLSKGEPEE